MSALNDLETYLEDAEVRQSFAFQAHGAFQGHGAHPSLIVILEGGVGALAKPRDQEPIAGSADREAAAWLVAKALGWTDLMATTVLREIPRPNGDTTWASVAALWPMAQPDLDPSNFTDEEIWRAAVFDVVVAAADRVGHNWLGVPSPASGGQPRLKLVDHGYGFSAQPFASEFYNRKQGEEIPDELLADLSRFLDEGSIDGLDALLESARIDEMNDRARKLAEGGVLQI